MDERQFTDADGRSWVAYATGSVVAHGRQGAVLAFRPLDGQPGDEIRSTITFNSMDAARFAIRTLGVKELRRRLELARLAVGGV